MDTVYLLIIIFEALALVLLVVFFLFKSHKLSEALKELQQHREQEKKQVEIQHQRDDYLAMLVHELRAPLAVIKGAADLIIKEAPSLSKEQIETLLGQIKKSSSSLLQIVNDILDVSKIESGKFSIKKVPGDINLLLKEICDYYLSWANEKQIKINLELEENIPQIKFDSERIKQVLNNLLSNALKFTDEYGNITIKTHLNSKVVQINVCDTGIGIPDDMKHKLFNKFVQVGAKEQVKEKGTGLGLFIAKGIVEAHGGNIWIEDNDPQGTKFVFTIPLES
jgi:signal transduction histidine kinase